MKILMVSNTYLPIVGGLERSVQIFTKKLREWGHEVRILVPELKGAEITEEGIIRVPTFFNLDRAAAFSLSRFLENAVEDFQPDVIHAHHPFLMGEMALRIATRFQKPLIFTYHIMFDQYAHYLPIPASLSRRFLAELAAGFANLSTRVIAPSESVCDVLLAEGVKTPIDVVPTGVDIAAFSESTPRDIIKMKNRFGIPHGALVLGYVGRLASEKNLEFLSRAAIYFMKKNSHAHFLAAGRGPCAETAEKLFAEAGMGSRFHYAGVLRNQELVNCYHAMDVFLFTSKSETQGMVLCEAMAAGTPVIALDAPGSREVVKDSINGRLLFRESEEEFDSALSWYVNLSLEKKKKLKSMAKETVKAFSTDACTLRALKTYENALKDCKPPKLSEQKEWRQMMRKLRTEWEIMANFGRAAGLALSEMISR